MPRRSRNCFEGIISKYENDEKEVEQRERNNTLGRAFSADRFTAKHLTMLGLFGVHLSIRRAEKKEKKDFLLVVLSSGRKTRAVRGTGEHQKSQKKPAMEKEKKTRARAVFSSFSDRTRTVDHRGMGGYQKKKAPMCEPET